MRASTVFRAATAAAAFTLAGTAATAAPGNVLMAGGEVHMSAPVTGDFHAAGGRVDLDRPVAGDAAVAGGSVRVRAPVGDDLRAAAGDLEIDDSVGGELLAAGGNVTIGPSAFISRGAHIRGATVRIEGRIDGGLDARGREVTIDGLVNGDVHASAETLRLGPRASIHGALDVASPHAVERADAATVTGPVVTRTAAVSRMDARPGRGPRRPLWGRGFAVIGIAACAAIFLLVAPSIASRASDRVRSAPWKALGTGFAAIVVTPMLALLLVATILGIPLGVAALALFPVLLLLGFVVGVLYLAHCGLSALHRSPPTTFAGELGWFVAALVVAVLVGSVPLAGGVLLALLGIAGAGALLLEVLARVRSGSAPPPAGTGTGTGTGTSAGTGEAAPA